MAKASLAAQTGAVSQNLTLPGIFSAPQEKVEARFIAPYIAFCHPKRADEWAKLVATFGASAITEGDIFLVTSKKIYPLNPGKVGVLKCKQFWAEVKADGEIVRTTFKEMPKPWKEHIEGVLLVYTEDAGIIPANVCFRSTKCPAGKALADALISASSPDWGQLSPQHNETLVCAQPFMRFWGELGIGSNRTSKSSGLPYRPAVCTIKPTAVAEWRALDEFCKNPETMRALELAANRYEERMAEVTKKAQ